VEYGNQVLFELLDEVSDLLDDGAAKLLAVEDHEAEVVATSEVRLDLPVSSSQFSVVASISGIVYDHPSPGTALSLSRI
jgi:hypothetical protein